MNFSKIYCDTKEEKKREKEKKEYTSTFNDNIEVNIYSEMNNIVFSELDFTADNSKINTDNKNALETYFKRGVPYKNNLNLMGEDFSTITMHVKFRDLVSPFILADNPNAISLGKFIQCYDELNEDNLAKILCEDKTVKTGEFSYSFNFIDFIAKNEQLQFVCSRHSHYLAGFEILKNAALTKKNKELVYDFKFNIITNRSAAVDLNLDKAKSREDRTDPLIKSAKIAEEIIDAFKKTKTTPPNCGSHVKRECECKCHDDGVPSTAIKIIEVKDPSELPKAIRDLLGDIL